MSKNIKPSSKELVKEKIKNKIELFLNCYANNFKGINVVHVLKYIDTYVDLINLYKNDKRPFSVAYSGGKDSTVALDMCLKALLLIKFIYGREALSKTTYVMFSDTLLEMDPVIESIHKSIEEIQKFADTNFLNVHVEKVSPIVKNTYFSLLIGKGYMATRRDNRWCTDRLKILPQKKAIVKLLNKHKEGFIAITGQRQDESVDRAKRMQILTIDGSFKEHEFKNCNLYAPVEHWKSNDIWSYIYNHSLEWVDSNTLGRVYAEAASDGDECRSLLEGYETGNNPGCSQSSRYGCWVCLLFTKDKTLNNLTVHHSYMIHMENFRNWLVQYRQAEWDNKRDVYIHGKHKMKNYDIDNHRKGMKIPGGYTVLFRREMLMKLMETERLVIKERGKPLITDEELSYIQECWIEDGDTDMWVKKIAYDRNITISNKYRKVLEAVSRVTIKDRNNLKSYLSIDDIFRGTCSRFYCQMAIQLEDREHSSKFYLNALNYRPDCIERKEAVKLIKTLPLLTKMDFVNTTEENYIREEWKNDKIGFMTFMDKYINNEIEKPQANLFGYDGDYGTHFEALEELEEKGDIIDCEKISLADKMRFFDTCNGMNEN